jgi:hypothetical protein
MPALTFNGHQGHDLSLKSLCLITGKEVKLTATNDRLIVRV